MQTFLNISSLRSYLNALRRTNYTIGFVPTMGSMHDGHASLVRRSGEICDVTLVSIFVNPSQFSPKEDFMRYPRDVNADLDFLSKVGADVVFLPRTEEMYPYGASISDISTRKGAYVDIFPREDRLESKYRPQYFSGVSTVVTKLLVLVNPDYMFLGQKDIEQCYKIRTLVRDLLFSVKLVICPTTRDQNQLALSSRNLYLSTTDKGEARLLYLTLLHTAETMRKITGRPLESQKVVEMALKFFRENRKSDSTEIEYLSISRASDLSEHSYVDKDTEAVIIITAKIGGTRLLDNMLFNCTLDDIADVRKN